MEVGAKLIGMVKTDAKGFCKETIYNLTKNWPGGSYLVLRSNPMLPVIRPIIDIGYKYNVKNIIYFIFTYNAGSIQAGFPYIYKYPDQFTNVAICPVVHTLVMSKFFSAVNEVDSHKNQGSLIWFWRSSGFLSVVGYVYSP